MSTLDSTLMWAGLAFALIGSLMAAFMTTTPRHNAAPSYRTSSFLPSVVLGIGALLLIISATLQFAGI